jgi:hypothetical protein
VLEVEVTVYRGRDWKLILMLESLSHYQKNYISGRKRCKISLGIAINNDTAK